MGDPLISNLSPELRELLASTASVQAIMSYEDVLRSMSQPHADPDPPEEHMGKKEAQEEVTRIHADRSFDSILAGDTVEEKRREFLRILRLLHPDRKLVSPDDVDANTALRLAMAAKKKLSCRVAVLRCRFFRKRYDATLHETRMRHIQH